MTTRVLAIVLLMLAACGQQTDTESAAPVESADAGGFDAVVEYRGERYEMVVPGECGTRADGNYLTWAVTLDAAGEPVPDAAHLYAMRTPRYSVIDFYHPATDSIVRAYREGRDRFEFTDGVLHFEGELGAGLTEQTLVHIECPDDAARGGAKEAQP